MNMYITLLAKPLEIISNSISSKYIKEELPANKKIERKKYDYVILFKAHYK